MSEPELLRRLIQERHHLKCTHIRQETVYEPSWSRTVEVFACTDDEAMFVYAWLETTPRGWRYVTVLGKPPIGSAGDVVRGHLASASTPPAPWR